MAKTKAEIDKNYEERHKEERKEKYLVWGTSVGRRNKDGETETEEIE